MNCTKQQQEHTFEQTALCFMLIHEGQCASTNKNFIQLIY